MVSVIVTLVKLLSVLHWVRVILSGKQDIPGKQVYLNIHIIWSLIENIYIASKRM